MIVQCPDCQTKMRPKPPVDTKAGTKVVVVCRCGTRLRFTMPMTPRNLFDEHIRRMFDEAPFR